MNRVLIVEDETVARKQLVQLFKFENFEVAEADCGQAGIAAAAAATPDLVICDIMMPGTDGFGVLQALRSQSATALTPFIFLTAKAGGQDVRQGMGKGADDYITKPFDPETLLASARQRLSRRKLQIEEAEQRATETGMAAAASLPGEMEGCLSHLEAITDAFGAKFNGDPQATKMRHAMKQEIARLRNFSQRLRLYSELPNLYGRRFSGNGTAPVVCSHEVAVETALSVAAQWSRQGDLEVAVSPALVPLSADSLALQVRELVDNACKFSAPASPVVIEARAEPGYWKMVVADHGFGMRSEQIRGIGAFKQFWHGATKPGGLGLGLVLVQAITRLHSGEVLIESEPSAGTRVTIMVPTE